MRLIDADEFESYLIYRYGGNDTGDEIIEDLTHQPTVDAVLVARCKDCVYYRKVYAGERKRGRWREYPIADGMNQCSECGILCFGESNFCPNCGSDMRGEANKDD